MKTAFTSIIFALLFSNISFAQPTPGTFMIGGGFGFNFSQTPNNQIENSRTSFNISPGIGKFVSEKYFIEGGARYSLFHQKSRVNSLNYSIQKDNSYGAYFGVTRYFPIIERLYITAGAFISPSYTSGRIENMTNGVEYDQLRTVKSLQLSISPGLAYFLNPKWMLFTQIGGLTYQASKLSNVNNVWHNLSMNANANSFTLGVRYVIGGKQ